jgi:TP901 family phage tail tape measure protein
MAIKIPIIVTADTKKLTGVTKGLDQLGKAATMALAAVAAAGAAIAVLSVREFAKFDGALQKSVSIMGDLSSAMRDDMASAAREVAKTTTFSAEQAAESFFFLASAGLDAEQSISALPQVAAFAQAGMFDMALATDLLTDAQSALGLSSDDTAENLANMARVSDVLVKANTLANASVEQFSTSLTTKAGTSLKALGKDVEEGVAVLAVFADQGIKAELAGNQLAIVLRDLTTKAINNKDAFAEMGVSVFDSEGEMRNIADVIADLEVAMDGMSDETAKATLLQLGFTDKSVSAIQALLGQSDAIKAYEIDLRNAGGTTKEVADKQLKTLNAQLALLQSAFLDVAISIGEQIAPAFEGLVTKLRVVLPIIGEKLVAAIEKVDFEKIADDLLKFVTVIVNNLDTIAAVGKALLYIAGALAAYRTATMLATTATALFSGVLKLHPFGLVITGLAAIVALSIELKKRYDDVSSAVEYVTYAEVVHQREIRRTEYDQKQLKKAIEGSTGYLRENYDNQLKRTQGELNNLRGSAVKAAVAIHSVAREQNQVASLTARYKPKGAITAAEQAALDLEALLAAFEDDAAKIETGVDTIAQARQSLSQEITGIVGSFQKLTAVGSVTSQFEQEVVATFALVDKTIDSALDSKVISAKTATALRAISDTSRSIQMAIAKEREALATQYADLTKRLGLAKQMREDVAGSIALQADLIALGTTTRQVVNDLGDVSEESVFTSQTIIAGFRTLLETTKKFQQQLITLRELGLDPTLFKQIIDSGTEAGSATADAIIAGGPEAVSEINNLFTELNQVGEEIGKTTSEVMFNGGESAIQGLIDGVIAQDEALVEAAKATGEILTTTLQAAIDGKPIDLEGILEALRAFESDFGDLGDLLGQSFAEALQAAIDAAIAKAQAALAAAMPSGSGGGGSGSGSGGNGGGGGGGGGGGEPPNQTKTITEAIEEVADVVEKVIAPLTANQQAIVAGDKKGLRTSAGGLNTSSMSAAAMRGKDAAIQNFYNVSVTADTRTGGAKAGEEIVKTLRQYTYNNGTIDLSTSARQALK